MSAILVNEVPNEVGHVVFAPVKPILHGRFDVKDGVAVQFCRVHFIDLILRTMLATINRTDDDGIRVQGPAGELSAISQLEDALTDLRSSAVDLIEKQTHRFSACPKEPCIWAHDGCLLTVDIDEFRRGHAKQVAFSHLAGTSLYDWKPQVFSNLVDYL